MSFLPSHDPKIAATDVLRRYWNGNLPVKVEEIARLLGVRVLALPTSAPYNQYSGYFVHGTKMPDGVPTIYYNSLESQNRQRFTIAHEIGHFALGHDNAPRDIPGYFSSGVVYPQERSANQFAAELLMPESAVRFMIERAPGGINEMARYFMVSPAAMGYRLSNLGFSL